MAANDQLKGTTAPSKLSSFPLRLVPVVDREIQEIEKKEAQLTRLIRTIGGFRQMPEGARSKEFTWQEQWPMKFRTTIGEAMSATETVGTFDDVTFMIPGLVGKHLASGEQVRVESITSSDATLKREVGVTPAAAWASGDDVVFLAPAAQEGSNPLQRRVRMTNMLSNYSQRFMESQGVTFEHRDSSHYGPAERMRINKAKMADFAKQRERAYILNEPSRHTDATSGEEVFITGGLRYFASMYHIVDFGGPVAYESLMDVLVDLDRWAMKMTMMGGSTALTTLSKIFMRSGIARNEMATERFGFDVSTIVFPNGSVDFFHNRTFDDIGMDDESIIFDPADLAGKQFQGFQVGDIEDPKGAQRDEWQFVVDDGLQFDRPIAAASLRGMGRAA